MGADLTGLVRGITNSIVTFPIIFYTSIDYYTSLRGLDHTTKLFKEVKKACHERASRKLFYLSKN
jgi:hypothetical protein